MTTIPGAWQTASLGELADDISYGFTASATNKPVGPRMLRITDIQNGKVDWTADPYCGEGTNETDLLKVGDLVIARTGATTGKSFLIRALPGRAIFASYLIRVRASKAVEPEYLYSYLQSADYWSQIQTVAKGTAQPGANASILSRLSVPLAPVREQRRIVTRLDGFSAKSSRAQDHLDNIPRLVEKYKQAILAVAFRGDLTRDWRNARLPVQIGLELRAHLLRQHQCWYRDNKAAKKVPLVDFSGETDLPLLPISWTWMPVAGLATSVVDGVHKKPTYVDKGIPFVTVRNLTAGPELTFQGCRFITEADHAEFTQRTAPTRGDILISKDGTLGVTRAVRRMRRLAFLSRSRL
jgi:Type I restriction modification DNA specificity domain